MSRNPGMALFLVMVVAAWVIGVSPSDAKKEFKAKPHKGQVGQLFINAESQEARGLVVMLSKKAIVVTDPETGFAGPFQNIQGKGTKTIKFSNAHPPITPAVGEEDGFNLVFRSYKSELKINGYYWTDAKGKRIGRKHSP